MKKILTLYLICCSIISKADYWTQKANFPGGARINTASFSIGDKGYVGTGRIGNTFYSDFWEYDQTTNVWTQKTNFPGVAREGAVGFSIGTKGYIATGWDGSSFSLSSYHKDLWEWDQATNTWNQKADLPGIERYVATGLSIGLKGYVGLGLSAGWNYQNDFWEYDPATNTWNQKVIIIPVLM